MVLNHATKLFNIQVDKLSYILIECTVLEVFFLF